MGRKKGVLFQASSTGDNVALPTAPASPKVWSHQRRETLGLSFPSFKRLKIPCIFMMPASAHVHSCESFLTPHPMS